MGSAVQLKLLLDTHIWVWGHLAPERLPPRVREALAHPDTRLYLSPISVWEVLVLARKGRLALRPDALSWTRQALRATPAAPAPLTHSVAVRSEELPGFSTNDPADRFLVATAIEMDLVVVTADAAILNWGGVNTLS